MKKKIPPGLNGKLAYPYTTPYFAEIKDLRNRNKVLQQKVYNLELTLKRLEEQLHATKK